jgi:hypothetical protein
MRSKFLTGLVLGTLVSLLGPNSSIAAEKSAGIAAYVKADSQDGNVKGDVIEIVRGATGREDTNNGQSGAGKRRNNEKGMSDTGKRKNGERGTSESGKRRGTDSGTSEPSRRKTPQSPTPGSEEPPVPEEEMPEPETGTGDFE